MGTRSKRKTSKSAPPPPHSQAVFSPKVLRSMTTRKPSGASALPAVGGTPVAGGTNVPAVPRVTTSRASSVPPSAKVSPAQPSPVPVETPSSGVLLEAEATPPPAASTSKGKGKSVQLPPLSSLDSSPHMPLHLPAPQAPSVVDLSYDLRNPTSRMSASRSKATLSAPASPTPSLASLIPNPSSTPGSLLLSSEPPNLFLGVASVYGILVESLPESVERWHVVPNGAEDPLESFGGKGGLLPDQSADTSALMRQVLLRWRSPHRLLHWDNLSVDLPGLIARELLVKATDFKEEEGPEGPLYSIRPAMLDGIGHVVLAVQQILLALGELRDVPALRAFQIDPNYAFTRLLERSTEKARLELTWETLLRRLSRAHTNIEAQIRSLYRFFNESDARLSQLSFDSTQDEIRMQYGTRSPRTELAKLWYAEDKRKTLPDHLRGTADGLVADLIADGYSIPAYNKSSSPKPISSVSARHVVNKQIQFAPVADVISSHPISRLPGLKLPYDKTGGPLSRPSTYRLGVKDIPPNLTTRSSSGSRPADQSAWLSWRGDGYKGSPPPSRRIRPNGRRGGGPPDDDDDDDDDGDGSGRGPPRQGPPPHRRPPGAPDDDPENYGRGRRPQRHGPPDDPDGSSDPSEPQDPPEGRRRVSPPRPAERWQVNHKIPMTALPEWNGEGRTLIDYLTDLASYSELGEMMEADIAQIAPSRFTAAAKDWFTTLPTEVRRLACSSYLNFILCIREHFMDAHWIDERTIEYEEMRFRQEGHSRESPLQFIQRRLKYSRFLNSDNDDNDVGMVQRILRTQPSCWAIHLNTETCQTVVELIRKLKTMNEGLIADWERSELARRSRTARASSSARRFYSRKSVAHNVEGNGSEASGDSRSPSPTQDAFAVDSRRPEETRNKWPKGGSWDGYSFTRDDSRSSDPPPRDTCWICTSPRHVHRECPHFAKWESLRLAWLNKGGSDRRSSTRPRVARNAETNNDEDLSLLMVDPDKEPRLSPPSSPSFESSSPDDSLNPSIPDPEEFEDNFESEVFLTESLVNYFRTSRNSVASAKPPQPAAGPRLIRAIKRRRFPEGRSSLGIKALHMPAHMGSLDAPQIVARLDSGADVTLMSEDFHSTLAEPPAIKEGIRMRLYQLTGSAQVLGYVRTKLLVPTVTGDVVAFDLEAYVVRGMRVPLLLGEDFQTAYELGVRRCHTQWGFH
ncbi:hypothetical protein PLEOSDRAFT_1104993 [Pleurotus ostreatus PC15]|uniref:Peptidase A2 domain-containing protein n=1 Tax=Pleurotus ostreatus (strain PC15) TaxID=1137138 RepID=A0A067NJU4_PLEO1|nr:hypothetical protein PLEOSDRAFT_1104993 [Pleurotus ostreatus PC15]